MGELATATGIHVETIRYYQRRGLFAEPYWSIGGTRRYEEAHVHRLRFIKNAQALGFDLDEVADLLALERGQNGRDAERIGARKLRSCVNASGTCAASSGHWPRSSSGLMATKAKRAVR